MRMSVRVCIWYAVKIIAREEATLVYLDVMNIRASHSTIQRATLASILHSEEERTTSRVLCRTSPNKIYQQLCPPLALEHERVLAMVAKEAMPCPPGAVVQALVTIAVRARRY